ncbi:MAG: TfoX/Sxy family protein [Candidatus Solibacter usitatus]|nr:TfoX/Sxy family protein [Candidatus Solibacter usitatus]
MAYDLGLADRVRSVLSGTNGVSERRMFGGLAFMVDGNMCCGIVKTDLMLRMNPEQVVAALRKKHTRAMDFTGRPMKSMLYVNAKGTDSDADLERWVRQSLNFVRTLPPK